MNVVYVVLEVPINEERMIPNYAEEILWTLEEEGWEGVKLQCVTDTPPTPHGREW